jgi:hypothetical protein
MIQRDYSACGSGEPLFLPGLGASRAAAFWAGFGCAFFGQIWLMGGACVRETDESRETQTGSRTSGEKVRDVPARPAA